MAPDLHPDAERFIEAQSDAPSYFEQSVAAARAAQRAGREITGPPEAVGTVEDVAIRGDGHGIPLRIYEPAGDGPHPVVVWAHGGSFVLGDVETEDVTARAIANAGDCVVVSVDYRLAPEHPFPAALRDVYRATAWAEGSIDAYGGDPTRLAVGGQSSGANLAAATAMLARDTDGPPIRHQILVVPALDHELEFGADGEDEPDVWSGHEHYLADELHANNPYAYPLKATDYSDLPSATVVTAGADRYKYHGEEYVQALRDAGGEATRHHYDDMIHVFFGQLQEPEWERARVAVAQVGADIETYLSAG